MTDLVAVSSVMASRYHGDNDMRDRFYGCIQHVDTRMSNTTVEQLKEELHEPEDVQLLDSRLDRRRQP
jgi:hypothetical protein